MSYSDLTGVKNKSSDSTKKHKHHMPIKICIFTSSDSSISSISRLSAQSSLTNPEYGSQDIYEKSKFFKITLKFPKILIPFVSCFGFIFEKQDVVASPEERLGEKVRNKALNYTNKCKPREGYKPRHKNFPKSGSEQEFRGTPDKKLDTFPRSFISFIDDTPWRFLDIAQIYR